MLATAGPVVWSPITQLIAETIVDVEVLPEQENTRTGTKVTSLARP